MEMAKFKKTNVTATTSELAETFGMLKSEVAAEDVHATCSGEWRWKSLDRNWRFYENTEMDEE